MRMTVGGGPGPDMVDTLPEFLEAMTSQRPALGHGLTNDWPASSWTFDGLRAMAAERSVTALLDLPSTGGVLAEGQQTYEHEMTFGEFLDTCERTDRTRPCYLGYTRPTDLIPAYDQAFDFTRLTYESAEPTDTRLWIGSAGTCSGLHSDLKDNVFTQIMGYKQVILVPFRQTPLVYPFLDNIVNSRVDPEHLDSERFPRFHRADVLSCLVGPGDTLFIPRGWWHYLRSESPSISINHWFGPQIPGRTFLATLVRLGPPYIGRTLTDLVRYSLLGAKYRKDFFFTPPSTGERLYNLIRHGDFSRDNDPASD